MESIQNTVCKHCHGTGAIGYQQPCICQGDAQTLEKYISALVAAAQASREAPVPFSGADETPPVFGRRWKLAEDGFGLQRDDVQGRYVDIEDALSVLHAALAEQASRAVQEGTKSSPVTGSLTADSSQDDTPSEGLALKSNVELAEVAGYNPNMWNILGSSLEPLMVLVEQRTLERLQIKSGVAGLDTGNEASLTAEIERLDNANKSLHEYTLRVNNECDRLQARITELESQQVPEWFQEQVLKVQTERDALQAEALEVKGYWKAAAAKNRQLMDEVLDLRARLEELHRKNAP